MKATIAFVLSYDDDLMTDVIRMFLEDLPVRLEVLRGSPADRFYERHGFVKLAEDDIEAEYERPAR